MAKLTTVNFPAQSDYIDLKSNRALLVPKKFSYKRVKRNCDNPTESHTKLDTGVIGSQNKMMGKNVEY